MTEIELEKEISCVRALLERILRVMDEGLFVDYQMEKYGRIGYKVLPEKRCSKCNTLVVRYEKYEYLKCPICEENISIT